MCYITYNVTDWILLSKLIHSVTVEKFKIRNCCILIEMFYFNSSTAVSTSVLFNVYFPLPHSKIFVLKRSGRKSQTPYQCLYLFTVISQPCPCTSPPLSLSLACSFSLPLRDWPRPLMTRQRQEYKFFAPARLRHSRSSLSLTKRILICHPTRTPPRSDSNQLLCVKD